MNKDTFLTALRQKLAGLPEEDIQTALDFYNELICDRMDAGMTEEEAVADIGSPNEVAKQILLETPLPKLVVAKTKPKRSLTALEIALLVVAFPIWGSVLCAVLAAVLIVYCVLWSLVIAAFAVDLALVVSGVVFIFGAIPVFMSTVPSALLMIGGGLICIGGGIITFFVCKLVTKGIVFVTRAVTRGIKSFFIKKGGK